MYKYEVVNFISLDCNRGMNINRQFSAFLPFFLQKRIQALVTPFIKILCLIIVIFYIIHLLYKYEVVNFISLDYNRGMNINRQFSAFLPFFLQKRIQALVTPFFKSLCLIMKIFYIMYLSWKFEVTNFISLDCNRGMNIGRYFAFFILFQNKKGI